MAGETAFGGVIGFMMRLGVYDVILPFLLIFTIMYAILEKTKVFGTEKVGDTEITRRNINAMVAFVTAFLVLASSGIIEIFNKALPRIMVLLVIAVMYLMLIGVFWNEKEELKLSSKWKTFFMIIMFIGVVLVFAGSIETDSGESWLEWLFNYIAANWNSTTVSSIVLLIIIVGLIMWITANDKPKTGSSESDSD
jgi:hypothetical membrane protein